VQISMYLGGPTLGYIDPCFLVLTLLINRFFWFPCLQTNDGIFSKFQVVTAGSCSYIKIKFVIVAPTNYLLKSHNSSLLKSGVSVSR
jgi:hypothetical protein